MRIQKQCAFYPAIQTDHRDDPAGISYPCGRPPFLGNNITVKKHPALQKNARRDGFVWAENFRSAGYFCHFVGTMGANRLPLKLEKLLFSATEETAGTIFFRAGLNKPGPVSAPNGYKPYACPQGSVLW